MSPGGVVCPSCGEAIAERRPAQSPPHTYVCAICDARFSGWWQLDLGEVAASWAEALEVMASSICYGPAAKRASTPHSWRRREALRQRCDGLVKHRPGLVCAIFDLEELPEPVRPVARAPGVVRIPDSRA